MATRALSLTKPADCIHHAEVLMARESVTPNDAGCQAYLVEQLNKYHFDCVQHQIEGVSNLIARWGHGPLHFAFSGHTDVVPPGPTTLWNSPPFSPTLSENKLFGRGAADMKTGIAAMLAATQRMIHQACPDKVSYWWLITSDEEGEAEHGSKWIKAYLDEQGVELDMCLVGEPSASKHSGDMVKVGRRGSLSATIDVQGKQGHVAYPQACDNAIHKASQLIQQLLSYDWDSGSHDFPGTTLQVTHVDTGAFTDNLVPGETRIAFNVRYSSQYDETALKVLLSRLITSVDENAFICWSRPCNAYLSQPRSSDCLISAVESSIVSVTGRYPVISTSGGTSDGRFFASPRTQVVEVGVPNTTIHQVNENVHLSDLITLEDIYTGVLNSVLGNNASD